MRIFSLNISDFFDYQHEFKLGAQNFDVTSFFMFIVTAFTLKMTNQFQRTDSFQTPMYEIDIYYIYSFI